MKIIKRYIQHIKLIKCILRLYLSWLVRGSVFTCVLGPFPIHWTAWWGILPSVRLLRVLVGGLARPGVRPCSSRVVGICWVVGREACVGLLHVDGVTLWRVALGRVARGCGAWPRIWGWLLKIHLQLAVLAGKGKTLQIKPIWKDMNWKGMQEGKSSLWICQRLWNT